MLSLVWKIKTTIELTDADLRDIILKHLNLPAHGEVRFRASECKDQGGHKTGEWYIETRVECEGE